MVEHQSSSRSTEGTKETPGFESGEMPDSGWAFESQAYYDPDESRDLTTVIVEAIAEATGVGMEEINEPPLYEVVGIEGIDDALFGCSKGSRDGTESKVEFRYNEYKISVKADGCVTVASTTGSPSFDDKP